MEISSLTYKTFKNVAYSVIGYAWPMVFAIFITPIVIFKLGVRDYGIYLFIYSFLAILGLIDIGIGSAITKYVAHYIGKKDKASLFSFVQTADSLLLVVASSGLAISAVITLAGIYAPAFLPATFSIYSQYAGLFLISGAMFFFTAASSVPGSLFAALQRFDVSNKITVASVTTSSIGLLITVLLGGSLTIIFLVQFFITVAFAFVYFHYAKRLMPEILFGFGWEKRHVKDCYSFGFVSSINNIASTALASLDRLIIPFYAGPSNLTYYSVPGNVTGKIPGFANTLAITIFPMAAELEGAGDRARIETFYVRSFRLITIVAAALTVTAIAFSYKALLFWLNADFAARSTGILIMLALTNFILALFGPLSSFLLGLGKLRFLSGMSVLMAALNAILLLVLLPLYGIIGAAWAYLLSVLPVAYMFYHVERRYLTLSGRRRYYIRKLLGVIVTSTCVWVIDSYLLSPLAFNLWTLIAIGTVSVALYVILYGLFGFFEPEDWRDMMLFFQQAVQRLGLSRK